MSGKGQFTCNTSFSRLADRILANAPSSISGRQRGEGSLLGGFGLGDQ